MRVAIDVLLAEKHPGGMLFATHALLHGLARIDRETEYVVITGRPQDYQTLAAADNFSISAVHLRSWRGSLIQHQLLLPTVLHQVQPDVLHVPAFAAPLRWSGPFVLTVHDLAFMTVARQPSLYARLYWRHMLRISVTRAQRVIAVSEQTRQELISWWGVDAGHIRVIHNAPRPALSSARADAEQNHLLGELEDKRYLLHVGRIVPRKNVESLVRAFGMLAPQYDDLHLVLAGGAGYGSEAVTLEIEHSSYRDRIHLAGWVTDAQLNALYTGAAALVFPSLHEGFGLPIIEAMAHGTPVVASPQAASIEVGGDAVVRAASADAAALAEALERVLQNEELRRRLNHAGKAQAEAFSTDACAAATRQVYLETAQTAHRGHPLVPAHASEGTSKPRPSRIET